MSYSRPFDLVKSMCVRTCDRVPVCGSGGLEFSSQLNKLDTLTFLSRFINIGQLAPFRSSLGRWTGNILISGTTRLDHVRKNIYSTGTITRVGTKTRLKQWRESLWMKCHQGEPKCWGEGVAVVTDGRTVPFALIP